ncbi:MAG: hypothetical protein HY751_03005 [Nitrospinae bacterium]|nr:hypothetical protein [Nitrospinota bacterium]
MANLTSDRKSIRKDGALFAYPVAAATAVYSGSLVNLNASGYAVPAADNSAQTFAGKADYRGDNLTGANGDASVEGRRSGVFEFNASGMSMADINADAYVVDDNTVGRGVVAQPVNVTGVSLKRIPMSRGGSRQLSYTATGTTLAYGGGTAVNVGAGGEFVLTAADGSQILALVTSASLPGSDQADTIQLRHIRCGKIVEVVSSASVFVDILSACRF